MNIPYKRHAHCAMCFQQKALLHIQSTEDLSCSSDKIWKGLADCLLEDVSKKYAHKFVREVKLI